MIFLRLYNTMSWILQYLLQFNVTPSIKFQPSKKLDGTDFVISRQIPAHTLPPVTTKEIVEFDTQANEEVQHDAEPTNATPNK